MNGKTFRGALIPAFAAAAMLATPLGADAQRTWREARERFFDVANWRLDATAGYGNIGRMLLQDVGDRQRELNPEGAFSWGGGASVIVLDRTQLRIGFARVTGDLAYDDDTGDGGRDLDQDDIGDIGASILSIEAGRFLFGHEARFSPYARAGFVISWWGLDDDEAPSEFLENGGRTRLGASGALGLQYRFNWRFGLLVEAATFGVGNPFTGRESFMALTGETIDEPRHVSAQVYRAMLSVNLGRPRPFDRDRDR
jgi:hypothetical protein